MWNLIVGGITSAVGGYFENKKIKQQAKLKKDLANIEADSNWEEIQAEGSKSSWKDEWFTLVLSIPLILCFFPFAVEWIDAGFDALANTPEWYQQVLLVAIGASFGVKIWREPWGK